MVLKTDRLILRNMGQEDYEALCRILKDNDVIKPTKELSAIEKYRNGWTGRQRGIINMDSDSGPLL